MASQVLSAFQPDSLQFIPLAPTVRSFQQSTVQ